MPEIRIGDIFTDQSGMVGYVIGFGPARKDIKIKWVSRFHISTTSSHIRAISLYTKDGIWTHYPSK